MATSKARADMADTEMFISTQIACYPSLAKLMIHMIKTDPTQHCISDARIN